MSNQNIPATVDHNMYNPSKLPLDTLMVTDLDENFDSIEVEAPYFFDKKGVLCVSMETNIYAGDYYGEFTGGEDPHIHEKLVAWAKKQKLTWEWDTPGMICLVK